MFDLGTKATEYRERSAANLLAAFGDGETVRCLAMKYSNLGTKLICLSMRAL